MTGLKFQDYLGDGIYAGYDGYHIWLSTQEGHRIALEPPVLDALTDYRRNLSERVAETLRDQKAQDDSNQHDES